MEAEKHSKEPWRYCGQDRGGCVCGQIWSIPEDHPVADATIGKWGDDYPAIRPVDGDSFSSVGAKFEAYTELIEYGELPEGMGKANAFRIVACVNALAGLNPEGVKDAVEALEWIAGQTDLFFAECSQAEEIIARVQAALAKLKGEAP